MGQDVRIDRVTMRFGALNAVDDVSLDIRAGEFFSILGPSGCGKTTLLRLMSGFMEPSAGKILIGGRDMRGLGPNRRPTALIFQNLALFPLMPVWENIAFGLEARGVPKPERRKRAQELLDLIAMPDAGDKTVAQLSGGQRQRVAIARALAVEPQVMLLDEPLSALDLKLRQHMRGELQSIQRRTGVTFIYITHDQGEALTMSDRVAVMSRGRVEQVGAPPEIYNVPKTAFVAGFVGEANAFRGRIVERIADGVRVETAVGALVAKNPVELQPGAEALVFVRPEALRLGPHGMAGEGNNVPCTVRHASFEGSFTHLALAGPVGVAMVAQVANGDALPDLTPGAPVHASFRAADALALPLGSAA